jgi:predicted transposase/invertase (TIGR01784 family)
MRYLDPLTDFGFKKIFGEPDGKPLLISLLNDVLELADPIIDLQFQNLEQLPDLPAQRRMVYDLLCQDRRGRYLLVELQQARQTYFKDRALFYLSQLIRMQGQPGKNWDYRLAPVYIVAILNFRLDEPANDPVRRIALKDQNNRIFYDRLGLVFIELPRFAKVGAKLESHLDKWLYFLKHLAEWDAMPTVFADDVIAQGFTLAELYAMSVEERRRYDDELKHYRDALNMLQTAQQEGIEKGIEKGIEQGRAAERRALLEQLLVVRFGSLPAVVMARIADAELELLSAWFQRALTAASLAEVFAEDADPQQADSD